MIENAFGMRDSPIFVGCGVTSFNTGKGTLVDYTVCLETVYRYMGREVIAEGMDV